ncbi:MAG: PAS domain S-box protein [Bacteroidota bacterium]
MNKENANTANDNLRKKAIDLLKNKNSNNELKHSEADNLKLIQELEIHQLELELQNEELTHAKEQAELAYERFSELFDFSLLGYFTLSEEAEIIDMNHVGAKMLGKTRSKLLYSPFGFFVSEETKPIFNNFINEIFKNAKKATCDIKLLNVNLEATYVCLTGMVAEHNDRCIITALDITERKLAEEKLKVSEEKWASLFKILPVGVSVLDSEKNIIDTNKTLENILNITKEGLLNGDYKQRQYFKSDKTIMLPEEFPSARALSEGKDVKAVEIGVLKEDKSLVWTSVSASPMKFMEGVVTITNDITEHKLAEDKLKESEEKYRNLFNNMQVGVLRSKIEGLELFDFNDKFLEICEYTREEVCNKPSLMFWADMNERNEMTAILKREGFVKNYECKVLTKNGTIKKCISSIFMYPETGILEGTLVDISDRKYAEEKLKENEEKYRNLFNNIQVGLLRTRVEGLNILDFNDKFLEICEYTREELMNKSSLIFWADINERNEMIAILEKEGTVKNYECKILTKDGSIKNCIASIFYYRETGIIESSVVDISELKKAEAELHYVNELFNSFMENSPVYVFFKDENIKAVKLSKNYETMLGRPVDELLNKSMDDLFPSELSKSMIADDKKILCQGEKIFVEEQLDGRYYTTIKFPIKLKGKPTYLAGYTIDVTESRLAEEKLRLSNNRFQQMFNSNVMGVAISNFDWELLEVNDYCLNIINYSREEFEAKGIKLKAITPDEWLYAKDNTVRELREKGYSQPYEKEFIRSNGTRVNVLISNALLAGDEEQIVSFVLDISERKKVELALKNVNRLYSVLTKIDKVCAVTKDPQKLYDEVCKIAVEEGSFAMAWIGLIDYKTNKIVPVASAGSDLDYLNTINIDLNDKRRSNGPTGRTAKIGSHHIITDIVVDPDMYPWQQNAIKNGYNSISAFPLIVFGKVIGVLTFYSERTYFFNEEEVELLDLMSKNISKAAEFIEEEKIQNQITLALIKSEEKYRTILETALDGFWLADSNGNIIEVNDSYCKMSGYSQQELLKMNISDLEAVETTTEVLEHINKIQEQGKDRFESKHRCKNGSIIDVEISVKCHPIINEQRITFIRDITERKRAEEEIRNIQLLLKVSLESQKDTILISIDKDYNYLYFNKAHSDSMKFAYNTEVEIGMNILDFVTNNEDKNVLKENYERTLNGESHSNIRVYGYNNSACYESFFNPIKNDKNKIIGATVMARDITERMKAEEALKNSNQRYKELIELAVDGILVGTHEGYIIEANSTICTMTGRTKEELIGKHINEAIFTKDTLKEVPLQFEMLNKGEVVIRERYIIRPDGSKIIIEMRTKMMPNGTYQSIYRDITRRKAIEEKLKENQATLLEAQEMALIGNWVWDLKTDKVECSKIMLKILGVAEDEFDGTTNLFKDKFHPEDIEYLFKCIKEVYDGINPSSFDYRIIHKDGSVHAIHTIGKIEYDKKGKAVKYFGTIQDVTERKKIETQKETIKQLRLTAKYIDKAIEKERLAISRELHDDLGQSLTSLKMELKNIEKEVSDKKYSALFNNAAFHIDDNIKIVQRLTSQLRPAMLEHLGLNTTIEWYVEEYAQRNKIKVISNLDDRIELPNNISLAIFRIVQESLTNISRHSQADKVSITMNISKNKDIVNLKITDNGIGIDKNKLKSSKSFGLIIMQERVLSLDGKIEIQNKNGTIITIQIPIKES